jgi:succinyl-diaminopimelate desuccinylase
MPDLLERTARLVAVRSPSLDESALADLIETELRTLRHLEVHRIDDNVIARTNLGRDQRLVLAGHLDTVPANGNEIPRIEGNTLWGLGSADMKGSLAVFLELAKDITEPVMDLSFVFYVAEEIAAEHNGLRHLFRDHPELLAGDAAILGEPTDAWIEAGCQGTARVVLTLAGARAHTARPWMGENAIHRLGPILVALAAAECRRPVLDGCEYREAVQVTAVGGGVAGNVVPDQATLTVNLRFAPDRTVDDAVAWFHDLVGDHLDGRDTVELVDHAPAAAPGLTHPLLTPLIGKARGVRAKLGWTDVARFAAAGIPACNFGAGDAIVAHMADEHLERSSIEAVSAALYSLVLGT